MELTHKIDPYIDLRENYVRRRLETTGLVAESFTPFLAEAADLRRGLPTGGISFHSNGQCW